MCGEINEIEKEEVTKYINVGINLLFGFVQIKAFFK